MYNNISYNKDYYTIEKLMNSRKQNSVVYENDNCMWMDIKIIPSFVVSNQHTRIFQLWHDLSYKNSNGE